MYYNKRMKQSQKQVVNVIINNDKPKRKYTRHKQHQEIQSNTLPISYYNPNVISYNRQPSYGLSSINPILQEDPNITTILNKIQTLEPNIDEYRQMVNQTIHNPIQDVPDIPDDITDSSSNIFDYSSFPFIPHKTIKLQKRGRPSQPIHTLTKNSALSKYYRLKKILSKTTQELNDFNELKIFLNK